MPGTEPGAMYIEARGRWLDDVELEGDIMPDVALGGCDKGATLDGRLGNVDDEA